MRATKAAIVALLVISLLAACGPESQLRLSMRTVGVTVPRIVTPAVELVAPSAPVPVALPPVPPVVNQLPPPAGEDVPEAPPASAPPPDPCPSAGPFAVPKLSASETVDAPPANQEYVQRSTGTFTSATGEGLLGGPVRVTITNLPGATTLSGQQVRPWRVQRLDPATDARSVEVYQLVLPSSAPGASAPGVYLVGLAWSDAVRGTLTFQPSGNGLFVLPSPVAVSQNDAQYVGIATDPNTLTTLTLTRNIRARKRVDVCGQLVDTWTVEMTGRLVAPSTHWDVTWSQQLATTYGAVDVEDVLSLGDVASGRSWTRRLVSSTVPEEPR